MFKNANTAVIAALLFGLIALFAIAAAYMIFTKPLQELYNHVEPGIDAEHMPTFNKIKTAWDKWPLFGILTIVLTILIMVMKHTSSEDSMRY